MKSNELLFEWKIKTRIFHICHAKLSTRYYYFGRGIGLAATITSALVATSIFTILTKSENINLIILTGFFSIITVILSAANDFLKLPEVTLRHSQAVSLYGELRRDIEITLSEMDENKEPKKSLQELSDEWTKLDKKVPPIPNRLYKKIKKEVYNEESGTKKNNPQI